MNAHATIRAPRAVIENVSRRGFLRGTLQATSFVMAVQLLPFRGAFAWETGASGMPHGTVNDPHVFVSIDPDGTVTIVAHRSEMGTGSRTSVPMVLADEMEADWARVKLVQAPGDEPTYGNQDTDGSRSMRHFIQPMRQCGAAMRQMLEQAAAKRWGIDPTLCRAQNHEVVRLEKVAEGVAPSPDGPRLGFGELAEAAMALPMPAVEQLRLKDPEDFRYMGKAEVQIYDLHDITTGKARYGWDVRLPGMKYAVVARPPVVGGKVKSFDDSAARKVPGVERIVELPAWQPGSKFAPLGGVAVIASNTYAAIAGRDALEIEWEDGPNASYDTEAFKKQMEETAQKPGKVVRNQGDPDSALASATKVVTAQYYQPHMAHAPMEPPAALAVVKDGGAEIWAPVQSPWGTREDIANLLGLGTDKVKVNVTLLGGGFGRKSKCDYAQEAALLSKAMGGTPVMVAWTREDDIQHGFYHTTSVERIEAGLDADGKVTAWRHRSVAPTIMSTFATDQTHEAPFELGMGLVDMPFAIPNVRCENGAATSHARIGWFRSVSNIPHAFAVQSFAAELAHELGRDPKDVLLELIGPARVIDPKEAGMPEDLWNYGEPYSVYPIDTGRLRNVVELAAEKAGWGKTLPEREGLGIAVHRSFVTYVATVVHAVVDKDGTVRVPEVHTAIDCGFPVNPERIRSQIEGAAVMGMTLALHSGVTFKNGRAEQGNFHDYEMVRLDNYPRVVHTHIVDHGYDVPASGVGEPGVPPFAPALCNAIFAATGKRIRALPVRAEDLREA
jgi:isoquinoline 1-oxidoreductase beta subunit